MLFLLDKLIQVYPLEVVIPIGQTNTGLPIGMQIVGKRWKEMELLAIAKQIDDLVGKFQFPKGY